MSLITDRYNLRSANPRMILNAAGIAAGMHRSHAVNVLQDKYSPADGKLDLADFELIDQGNLAIAGGTEMAKLPDLGRFKISELKTIIKDAEKEITKKTNEELKQARKAAEEAAKKHGFSLNDIVGGSPAKKSTGPKSPPKFHNPDNPKQTWSGRGRQPDWFKEALEKGKKPEDLAI